MAAAPPAAGGMDTGTTGCSALLSPLGYPTRCSIPGAAQDPNPGSIGAGTDPPRSRDGFCLPPSHPSIQSHPFHPIPAIHGTHGGHKAAPSRLLLPDLVTNPPAPHRDLPPVPAPHNAGSTPWKSRSRGESRESRRTRRAGTGMLQGQPRVSGLCSSPGDTRPDKDLRTRFICLAAPCPEATSCPHRCPQGHHTTRVSKPRQERLSRASAASRPIQPGPGAPRRSVILLGRAHAPGVRDGIAWKGERMNSQLPEPKQAPQRRLIAIPWPCRAPGGSGSAAEPELFSSRRDRALLEQARTREAAPGASEDSGSCSWSQLLRQGPPCIPGLARMPSIRAVPWIGICPTDLLSRDRSTAPVTPALRSVCRKYPNFKNLGGKKVNKSLCFLPTLRPRTSVNKWMCLKCSVPHQCFKIPAPHRASVALPQIPQNASF